MLRTRLAGIAASALALGCLVPLSAIEAAPAEAATATGHCIDWIAVNSAPVRVGPYKAADTVESKRKGNRVAGPCWWYNNTQQHTWWMEVYMAGGGWGYIWVQNLVHSRDHECIVDGVDRQYIPGPDCGLIDIP
jgi:hypothetical protein